MSFRRPPAKRVHALALAVIVVAAPIAAPSARAAELDRAGAVARALARAPEAEAERAARAEAEALRDAAGGALSNPRLSLSAEGDGVGPIGADDRLYKLELAQEFDVHGRRSARRALATAEATATEATALERETTLAMRTAETYGALLLSRRRAALADSLAAASARLVAAAREAARRETISPYELRVLEREEARHADEALRARGAVRADEAALRALILAAPDEPLALVDDLERADWTCTPESLAARAWAAHPSLQEARAAEGQLAAETALLESESRAAPEVQLFVESARGRVHGEDFIGSFDAVPGFDGFASKHTIFGAGITFPLPFARTNAWETARSRLSTQRAAARRRRIESTLEPALHAGCATLAAAQERVALRRAGLAEAGADGARLAAAYREGRIDLDAYLAQRDRLAEALSARLDALADAERARIDLARISGLDPVTLAAVLGGAPEGTSR